MNFKQLSKYFFKLADKSEIKFFLAKDSCCAVTDKYQLAGVFIYFIRADFKPEDFTIQNFYLALYLCHEVYEEVDVMKDSILKRWIRKCKLNQIEGIRNFDKDRFELFQKMNFNGLIDRRICKQIFQIIPHDLWSRDRILEHSGVISNEDNECVHCGYPVR